MDEKRFNEVMMYVMKNYNKLSMDEKIKIFKDNGFDITMDDIRKHKPNMEDNYSLLSKRVLGSLELSNLDDINKMLSEIDNPTIASGVGGSNVVSNYAAKVLSKKNNIIATNTTLRDIKYMNLTPYNNLLVCSYGGRNFGVSEAFKCDLNRYLLSKNKKNGVTNINYKVIDDETSFISLADTLIPLSILLQYYLDGDINIINEVLQTDLNININDCSVLEVLSGEETSTAHTFIESTLTESGIAVPIIHDKYDYCHGRSNLNHFNDTKNILLFNNDTQLDKLYMDELSKYYSNVYIIDKKYEDDVVNDYYLTYQSMLLCKNIANNKNMELSNIKYGNIVKKLYPYKGGM